MKKTARKLLTAALTAVFLLSCFSLLRQLHEQELAREAYLEAEKLAFSQPPEVLPEPQVPMTWAPDQEDTEAWVPSVPEPESEPQAAPEPLPEEAAFLQQLDLAALQAVNPDVIGWLHIPDTVISYPLLRSHDNQEYLDLTWDRKKSRSGSIFLEQRSDPALTDFHTLIYGHNNKDGVMFSPLLEFGEQRHFEAHPTVWIALEGRILRCDIFSSYMAQVASDTYRLVFENNAYKQGVIDYYLTRSDIQTGVTPAVTDRLVTLSTCSGQGNYSIRWVVHTVIAGEYPAA